MATLWNRMKAVMVLNVPCPTDCKRPDCTCSLKEFRAAEVDPEGVRGVRVFEKRISGSVTILAGQKLEVPDHVLQAPDVKRAIDGGGLRLL